MIDPSRIGDMAEHYAITFLWDQGYQVFRNCGCTGPIDIVAVSPEGTVKLIDVKSYKGTNLTARSSIQKKMGVVYLRYNPENRKLKFVNHRDEVKQLELF
jgi:Holliday junction resolvase-like predicted endonuclease|tara:strand:+ start:128 stop:427 length:300 start_codon:yes stop_codon:yes gene_type:complete